MGQRKIMAETDITLILGCMYAGKSTELLRQIRRHTAARRNCLLVSSKKDVRYHAGFCTHDKETAASVSVGLLSEIPDETLKGVNVVGIDEGQFFPDIVEWTLLQSERGIHVIIAALAGDASQHKFGNVIDLIPRGAHVVYLTAVCEECNGEATTTYRFTDEKDVEVIGGKDKYTAVCRKCYNKLARN